MSSWSLKTGDTIDGRFEVLDILGEGGFGVVFKGRQISTDQLVAIKVMHSDRLDGTDQADTEVARFEREMKLIAQLKHPNIVRLIDTGSLSDGQLYTVLEYIQGESLYELIEREQGLEPREAKQFMTQVCDALCAAHAHGIVHRDLKPQNIMVTDTGGRRNAMVLDFGIAGIVEDQRDVNYKTLTAEGNIRGTPAYMAPEQLDSRIITPQTDVYAWGLVFLECLTGQPAVDGESMPAIIFQHMSPEPIGMPPALLKHKLGTILTKACAKPLSERYPSAKELLADLEECPTVGLKKSDLSSPEALAALSTRNKLTIPAHLRDLDKEFGLGQTIDSVDIPNPAGSKNNKNLFIALGVLVLLVIGASVIFLTQGKSEGEGASLPDSQPPATTLVQEDATESDSSLALEPETVQEPEIPLPATKRVPAVLTTLGVAPGFIESHQEIWKAGGDSKKLLSFDLSTDSGLLENKPFERRELDVMTHEVSWADWNAHLDKASGIEKLCPDTLPPVQDKLQEPVAGLGAAEAEFFCKSLGMRLPTIKEWEALARGPAGRLYGFEGELTDTRRAELKKTPGKQPVPEWNKTPEGIYNMSGGVREWTTCKINKNDLPSYCKYGYTQRGGSWKSSETAWLVFVTTYFSGFSNQSPLGCFRQDDIGFRCVRDPE